MTTYDPLGFGGGLYISQLKEMANAVSMSQQMAELGTGSDVTRQMREMASGLSVSRQMAELATGLDVTRQMREMASGLSVSRQMAELATRLDGARQMREVASSLSMSQQIARLANGVDVSHSELNQASHIEATALEGAEVDEQGENNGVRHDHTPALETESSARDDGKGAQIELPPGIDMLAWASQVFPKTLVDQFLEPIVADYQYEHIKALASRAGGDVLNQIARRYRVSFAIALLWVLIKAIGEVVKTVKGAG